MLCNVGETRVPANPILFDADHLPELSVAPILLRLLSVYGEGWLQENVKALAQCDEMPAGEE